MTDQRKKKDIKIKIKQLHMKTYYPEDESNEKGDNEIVDMNENRLPGGRGPWYNRSKTTYIVGVAGGTASGKTSVCREVMARLKTPWVQILSMDNAFDWKLITQTINDIKRGLAAQIPQYDFTTHSRCKESTVMYGADVVMFEGILTLHNDQVVNLLDLKLFVTEDDDIRLIRRIKRDMKERARSLESVLSQYQKTVKPSYEMFCGPARKVEHETHFRMCVFAKMTQTQRKADIIIPRGKSNTCAIDILSAHIRDRLIERGVNLSFNSQK
ncbi:hypothetical protein RFI_18057, partial [Reticulomyxa filosa]